MALLEHESNLDEDDSMSNTLLENLENDEEMAQQHKNNSDIDDKILAKMLSNCLMCSNYDL